MFVQKARGQSDGNLLVLFKVLDSSGTPSITEVCPAEAAGDISVVDTGAGDWAVTIKNFKGPRGLVNVQATSLVISTMASIVSATYTADSLAFAVKLENDASSATDGSVYVRAEAF